MKAEVLNGKLFLDSKPIIEDNYYSSEYLDYINSQSSRFYSTNVIFSNDVFYLHYVNRICLYEFILIKKSVKEIVVKNKTKVNNNIIDAANNLNIKVSTEYREKNGLLLKLSKVTDDIRLVSFLCVSAVGSLLSFVYYFLQRGSIKAINKNNTFALLHSNTSLQKIKKYADFAHIEMVLLADPIKQLKKVDSQVQSIFALINIKNCLKILFKTLPESVVLYKRTVEYVSKTVGTKGSETILKHTVWRIPHYCINYRALNEVFKNMNAKNFYSGEKESRWGVTENTLAEKYNKTATCIPHGLEYSIRFPNSIFGSVFYCTSQNAKQILQQTYTGKKFIYDENTAKHLYSFNNIKQNELKTVYFPEGRSHEKDEHIINNLIQNGTNFWIKFKLNDCASNYNFIKGVKEIKSYEEAISNSICIARNSTVLLEAVYNNSLSVSVLLNPDDQFICDYLYPSLTHNRIKKIYSVDSLLNYLKTISAGQAS